ncbi:MAG: hypothetical protein ABI239_01030 [Aquihabitans sp.]
MTLSGRRLRRAGLTLIAASVFVTAAGCSSGPTDKANATTTSAVTSFLPSVTTRVAKGPSAPRLSWDPIDGASDYAVHVVDDDGITWMWVGTGTDVEYGALPTPVDGPSGVVDTNLDRDIAFDPKLAHRWSVTALDSEGNVLAMSPITPMVVSD